MRFDEEVQYEVALEQLAKAVKRYTLADEGNEQSLYLDMLEQLQLFEDEFGELDLEP